MTYLLWIVLDKNVGIRVGGLGKIDFKKGIYLYCGSAKKNLASRLSRHQRKTKKLFWHIDYLLNLEVAKIREIWQGARPECRLAGILLKSGLNFVNKFGSSDCRCLSHLFYINDNPFSIKKILKMRGFKYADKSSI